MHEVGPDGARRMRPARAVGCDVTSAGTTLGGVPDGWVAILAFVN